MPGISQRHPFPLFHAARPLHHRGSDHGGAGPTSAGEVGEDPGGGRARGLDLSRRESLLLARLTTTLTAAPPERDVVAARFADGLRPLLRAWQVDHRWLGSDEQPIASVLGGGVCPARVVDEARRRRRHGGRPRTEAVRLDVVTTRSRDAGVLVAATAAPDGRVLMLRLIRPETFEERDRLLLRMAVESAFVTLAAHVQAVGPATPEPLVETLGLLLDGLSEKEIAYHLGRTRHTVHAHIRRLYLLHDVNSRAELLAQFIRRRAPHPKQG